MAKRANKPARKRLSRMTQRLMWKIKSRCVTAIFGTLAFGIRTSRKGLSQSNPGPRRDGPPCTFSAEPILVAPIRISKWRQPISWDCWRRWKSQTPRDPWKGTSTFRFRRGTDLGVVTFYSLLQHICSSQLVENTINAGLDVWSSLELWQSLN